MKTNWINRYLCFGLVFCSSLLGFSACGEDDDVEINKGQESLVEKAPIRDMVLIYTGGSHRYVTWDKEHFKPYVYLAKDTETPQWLFDGFLFLELHDGNGYDFASFYGRKAARKTEWITLVSNHLKPGNAIRALDDCIGEIKNSIPGPFTKRKVVMVLPEPIPNTKDWGQIGGKTLDFSIREDRIEACKWYVDFAIKRFKLANMENVQLCGFYWLAEEATNSRDMVKDIALYIQQEKKLKFYWIPYYGSDGCYEWNRYGFDQAYLQPNHFFTETVPDSRIDEAVSNARKYGMSLEMEFDARALKQYGWGKRMKAYIDRFESNGVFEKEDIAYYQGDDAFFLLKHSAHEEDNDLYYELAEKIASRQKNTNK